MPLRDIPAEVLVEKNQLATLQSWHWLYEIDVPAPGGTITYRLVRNPEEVEFDGYTYAPFPITHDTIERDDQGDLPTTKVTVSNVTREIIASLENYSGLVGQRVRIKLVNSISLGQLGAPVVEEAFTVSSSTATEDAVTLSLASTELFDSYVPKNRLTRFHCRFAYRGEGCGYALDPGNGNYLPTCDKTLNGSNGCQAHGDSYTGAGLTPLHPDRFGGFPGIPVQTTGGRL